MTYTCVPYGNGIPAVHFGWSGPPLWWDAVSGAVPVLNKRDDDPRWRGAVQRTYGDGAAFEHAIFRGLNYPDGMGRPQLFLSWRVFVDPQLDAGLDRVTLGLQRTGATEAFVIRMAAFQTKVTHNGDPTAAPLVFKGTQGGTGAWTWAPVDPPPAWIGASLRSWVRPADSGWTVELMVPLHTTGAPSDHMDDGGFDAGDPFNLWYEIHVSTPAGPVYHTWPRTGIKHVLGDNFPAPTGETGPPTSAAWPEFKLSGVQWDGGPPTDPNCEPGISIARADIFTDNPDPLEILYSSTAVVTNRFHARPWNRTGATVASGQLTADFRIANWGSQPTIEDVTDPTTLWKSVGSNSNTSAINDTDHGDITVDWRLNAAEIAEFEPPPLPALPERNAHQCILVELSGGALNFMNASAFQNMDVAHASEFERPAEISVKGLEPVGDPSGRNVYLYLQTLNMPATADGKPLPRLGTLADRVVDAQVRRTYVARNEQPRAGNGEGDGGGFDVNDSDDAGTLRQLAKTAPTYMVHVYHETDEMSDEGKPVLRPQTSFGYFADHPGPLFGWDTELAGAGLQEIAPNFYKVVVPHQGTVNVTTRIKAWEKRRPWWWSCAVALFAIPVLGAILRALLKNQ